MLPARRHCREELGRRCLPHHSRRRSDGCTCRTSRRVYLDRRCKITPCHSTQPNTYAPPQRKEPSFGVHSTFKDNATNQIYLLGGGPNLQNFLARIPVGADLTQRSNYQYLSASNRWIPSFTNPNSDLKPLLPNTAQGSIMKPSFAPPGKPYMYMGVGWWMQSKFYIAAAPRIEGPWDLSVLCTAGRLNGVSQYRYCIYPHEWSWRPRTGELFCTWNEDGPSRVIGATVKFAIEGTVDDDDEEESGAGTPGVGLMPAVTGGVAKEASSAQESWSTGGSGGGGLQGAFQKFMSAFR